MKPTIWIMERDGENYRSFSKTMKGWEKWSYWDERFLYSGSFASEWEPVDLILFDGNPGEKRKERRKSIPDFINGYIVHACSDRARKLIEPLVRGQVEFLPLTTPIGPYWEMNIQRLECLDIKRAVVKFFEDGRIMRIIKYSFRWDRLEKQHVFRLREVRTQTTFVSDKFKRVVEENGLTGLEFYPVPLVEE